MQNDAVELIQVYVNDTYDMTPDGIIKALDLQNVDFTRISAYGHFTNPEMPWEK